MIPSNRFRQPMYRPVPAYVSLYRPARLEIDSWAQIRFGLQIRAQHSIYSGSLHIGSKESTRHTAQLIYCYRIYISLPVDRRSSFLTGVWGGGRAWSRIIRSQDYVNRSLLYVIVQPPLFRKKSPNGWPLRTSYVDPSSLSCGGPGLQASCRIPGWFFT